MWSLFSPAAVSCSEEGESWLAWLCLGEEGNCFSPVWCRGRAALVFFGTGRFSLVLFGIGRVVWSCLVPGKKMALSFSDGESWHGSV